jgi:hypothetical protein
MKEYYEIDAATFAYLARLVAGDAYDGAIAAADKDYNAAIAAAVEAREAAYRSAGDAYDETLAALNKENES